MTNRLAKNILHHIWPILFLSVSIQIAYSQIPNFELDPITALIRSDTRGFQGVKPKDEKFIKYSVLGQNFLPDGIILKIPTEPIQIDSFPSVITNPYTTLMASLYVDKVSDKVGRIALTTPGCKESITAMLEEISFKEFSEATKKIMEGVDSVNLLLLIKDDQSGRLYLFYRLNKSNTNNNAGPIYIRSFENVNGLYFVSCLPINSPMPLNIWNALITGAEFYSIR